MESDGTTILGEWSSSSSSFNGEMYYSISSEEADFMAQLLGNCSIPISIPNESLLLPHVISSPNSNNLGFCYWTAQQHSAAEPPPVYPFSSDHHENTMYSFSKGTSTSTTASFFPVSYDYPHPILTRIDNENSSVSCYLADDNDDVKTTTISNNSSMEFEVDANANANADAGDEYLNPDDSMESAGDGKIEIPIPETSLEDNLSETSSKKRPRIPIDHVVVKNKRTVKTKKNQRSEIKDGGSEKHTVSNCLSEDESINVSQELKASSSSSSALNLNGKTRASRGSATDPQSLYARKRRERINERLRILQNLVPNGTKVDISTMLEEAVQYVKFLQLQIKLLSSDDLWMYAPIAYNGMNIGLDLKIGSSSSS